MSTSHNLIRLIKYGLCCKRFSSHTAQETANVTRPVSATTVFLTNAPCGGFVGYLSYEAGLETISVALHASSATTDISDIGFAFVHRSIVIDNETGQTYIQSLLPNDQIWVLEVEKMLNSFKQDDDPDNASLPGASTELNPSRKTTMTHEPERRLKLSVISTPQERHYRDKVLKCQESLAVGDSYELCLTDETIISVPNLDGKGLDPWDFYNSLRRKNPARFGAFLPIANATVVGTGPERFLKWSRNGHCGFRPIKGTVKKSSRMIREVAHSILNSSKERAENLMIVDLIRHDLIGIVGAKNCSVFKLMTVEKYEHVYQLVSVIEGQLPSDIEGKEKGPTGLDVLKASLLPGSMT